MTPDAVAERLVALLGAEPRGPRGVVHSAYVDARTDALRLLRIGPFTPRCEADGFLLHAARASADAILTTGRILREEPLLRYDLGAHLGLHEALLAYRVERLDKADPPRLFVLTRGEIPRDHPALRGYARATLLVGGPRPHDVDAAGLDLVRLGERTLGTFLRERVGEHPTLLVEAGVETVVPLYRQGGIVDELVLTCVCAGDVDPAALGGSFPSSDELAEHFGHRPHVTSFGEGARRFEVRRYRRDNSGS